MIDLNEGCKLFNNGHRFIYDPEKSRAEESVFTCSCGAVLGEMDDAPAGC